MHSRRLACFLLGLWLGGGLFMQWVAYENAATVDRMFANPDPAATLRIKVLGTEQARLLLRFEAAEQNRFYFGLWETAQAVLAALFFFFLLFGTTEGKFSLALALALMLIVLTQLFALTPEINGIGKLLDFAPIRGAGDSAKFRVLQYAYIGFDLGKFVIQLVLTGLLIARGRARSAGTRPQPELAGRFQPRV